MTSELPAAPVSKKMLWAGRIISTLVALALIASGVGKFFRGEKMEEGFTHLGWDLHLALGLGTTEIACAIIYAIPRTSVLGAILLTGYLGGATATHVRVGDPFFTPVILGVVVWGGLYLRCGRLRALIPLRS
jgi:xanthine/uracil permease